MTLAEAIRTALDDFAATPLADTYVSGYSESQHSAEVDRTELVDVLRRARAMCKRYPDAAHLPKSQAKQAELAAARAFIKSHAEYLSLPASIPSNARITGYDGRRVYKALAAELDSRGPRANPDRLKLRHETYLERRREYQTDAPLEITIRYHATNVVTVDPDGTITLAHNGWTTNTTADRINMFLRHYMCAAGFPGYIHVGGAYLPDSELPDGGYSTWYVIREDSAGRTIRREARRYPGTPRKYRTDEWARESARRVVERYWSREAYGQTPGFEAEYRRALETLARPIEWHHYTEQGAIRDYRIIERRGTYAHYPFPQSGFTIGPRGHIRSVNQIARDRRREQAKADKRRAEQAAREQAERERIASLTDDELAAERAWTTIPAGTPLYKVLDDAPALRREDSTVAGRAPYQTSFVWRIDPDPDNAYTIVGTLEPCGNAYHAATVDQLPQWYSDARKDRYNAARAEQVVYRLEPIGPVYSASGKCFMRSARLVRRLAHAEVLELLARADVTKADS